MICGKEIYLSQRLAIEAIKGMLGDADGRSHRQPSRAYFCEPCEGWHIHTENKTRKNKWKKQRMNKETDSTHPKQIENDNRFKNLIIHDPRKFKVK